MEKLTHIDFALGPGGWVKTGWRRDGRERTAWIRFEERTRRRLTEWVIAELRVKDPTAASLREIPLHRIALSFNALEISASLRDYIDEPVPGDLESAIREQYRSHPRKKLKRPAGRKLDDDFFRAVAFAYRDAAVRGLNPVQTLADDAGAPHSTVARWIAQARARGYLPPAGRGQVKLPPLSAGGDRG